MATSGAIHNFLKAINLPVDIRNICVLLAPGFSGLTAWATYMFTATMKDDAAGLLAAAFIGIAPGECGLLYGWCWTSQGVHVAAERVMSLCSAELDTARATHLTPRSLSQATSLVPSPARTTTKRSQSSCS